LKVCCGESLIKRCDMYQYLLRKLAIKFYTLINKTRVSQSSTVKPLRSSTGCPLNPSVEHPWHTWLFLNVMKWYGIVQNIGIEDTNVGKGLGSEPDKELCLQCNKVKTQILLRTNF
jgi:hypothetical protein